MHFKMALFSRKIYLLGAFLVLVNAISVVHSEEPKEKDGDDEATVETVEEENVYQSPKISPEKVYLAEHFDDEAAFKKKWVKSEAKKQGVDENIAKYDGKWAIQQPSRKIFKDDLGLVLTTEAKHAAIATLLQRPFEFKDKPFIVQYEVTMQWWLPVTDISGGFAFNSFLLAVKNLNKRTPLLKSNTYLSFPKKQ